MFVVTCKYIHVLEFVRFTIESIILAQSLVFMFAHVVYIHVHVHVTCMYVSVYIGFLGCPSTTVYRASTAHVE